MIALKMVRLIEAHSEELAEGLMGKLLGSERTSDLHRVPIEELRQRRYEIYHNLSQWLLRSTEAEVERRYVQLGQQRASQRVAYSQFCWAIGMTKDHLWSFLQREGGMERAMDLLGGMELLRLLDRFFDRALYYAAIGYERAGALPADPEPARPVQPDFRRHHHCSN